jgi:putative addiction module killer protein
MPGIFTIRETEAYARWFAALRDQRAKDRIDARIRRLSLGNAGDAKPVGGGISELRIDYGPGYRVYFTRRGAEIVLLLTGGDKSRQRADIIRAQQLAADWRGE